MRARSSERGSALLLSILATAMLGAGLMAVLGLSGAERRSVSNSTYLGVFLDDGARRRM